MKVVHTIASLKHSQGGPSRTVPSLCQAIAEQEATVHLFSQNWFSNEDANIVPEPAWVHTHLVRAWRGTAPRLLYSTSYQKKLAGLCRSEDISIIHDHGLWLPCNHAAAKVSRALGIPLVIQPRGMIEPWALSYRAWKKKIAWWLYQKRDLEAATVLVATSQQEFHGYRTVGLKQPVAVIPNGVNMPDMKERKILKKRDRYALFLSRIHPKKGLLNLVQAWDRVRPEGWRVIIAGADEEGHRQEVERAIARAGLEDCFLFTGKVDGKTKENFFLKADLFVLPTFSENFGVVVAEALSYGVPVITTKGAPWEDLSTERCGWWVEIGVEPLIEAIRTATGLSDEAREDMGRRGRLFVGHSFSWQRIAEQMLSVYRWILDEGNKPSCVLRD